MKFFNEMYLEILKKDPKDFTENEQFFLALLGGCAFDYKDGKFVIKDKVAFSKDEYGHIRIIIKKHE